MKKIALVVAVTLLFTVALFGAAAAQSGNGEPVPATLYNFEPVTVFASEALTESTNTDAVQVGRWASADLFITTDVAVGGYVTSTVQFSADGVNWADAYWTHAADNATLTVKNYVKSQSADGTVYVRVPLAGQYMRVKLDVTGTVTPAISGIFKNN